METTTHTHNNERHTMDTNTQNKPTPHPHAELIKAWASGAKIQMLINGEWHDRRSDKMEWLDDEQYRIKPGENEPWKPKDEENYFFINGSGMVCANLWFDCATDKARYDFGNCFRTREEAEAAAGRVKAALKGEVVPVKELEALKTRNENLHKAKEALINKQTELDGNALTEIEKQAIRRFRDGEPFPEAEAGRWMALSEGEAALIRALRDSRIRLIPDFATSVLCYPSDNGKIVHSHGSPIAFMTSPSTPSHVDEKIIAALKQIQAEQEANNG